MAGFVVGGYAMSWGEHKQSQRYVSVSTQARIMGDSLILDSLATGNTAQAEVYTNIDLDQGLATLDSIHQSGAEFLPGMGLTFDRISRLRAQSGHRAKKPEIEAAVQHMLGSTSASSK
jgi:hypothetical protein